MPKMKTNSGATKRFKVTASGKIKRKRAFNNHILTKKANERKHNLGLKTLVHPSDMDRISRLI